MSDVLDLDIRTAATSAITAPTEFIEAKGVRHGFRRFGSTAGTPVLFLQHFTGTMDNWDPGLTDPIAKECPVILFDNAGIGRSTGSVQDTVAGMAEQTAAFVDALGLSKVHTLGFSLGGMVAQELALLRPELVSRMVLAGTGPEGGENMSVLKPKLLEIFQDPASIGEKLLKLFFRPSSSSQAAGRQYLERLGQRVEDREPKTGRDVFQAQAAAIVAYSSYTGERFARLAHIHQPVFVTNGDRDIMVPIVNSFYLNEYLPNARLAIYPDSGHGSLFQYAALYARHITDFLNE